MSAQSFTKGKEPIVVGGGDHDDARSELGGLFESAEAEVSGVGQRSGPGGTGVRPASGAGSYGSLPAEGVIRRAPQGARVVGRGPVPVDPRKIRYDANRARTMPALPFGATRADRMDASEAGDYLHRIHQMFGIATESEDVIAAFDKALFFEHSVNGASLLQEGRGSLFVDGHQFDLAMVKQLLGVHQRRFFRAFADEIADVNREVLNAYDPYEPETAERHGQIMQLAVERGLQKYPHLVHDSSDAGIRLSVEERVALVVSKRSVLSSTVNNADRIVARPDGGDASK